MKILTIKHLMLLAGLVLCVCCGNSAEQRADDLLKQANGLFEEGKCDEALNIIDSLRKMYPEAVMARKQALKLYQDVELARARKDLEKVDGELAQAKEKYEQMRIEAENSKAEGKATAGQLTSLTYMRIKRDSLQTRFDMQCAKIKYIHKKQKE